MPLGGTAASCHQALPLSFHQWIPPDICLESYSAALSELSEAVDVRRERRSRKAVLCTCFTHWEAETTSGL